MKYEPILHKLSNGVTVILDPSESATVHANVVFKTGSLDEKPGEYGITHFCEHMLCKGTKRFPSRQSIDDYINDNAGWRNAYTNETCIGLEGGILPENTELLLDLFADQLQNSLFDETVLERERGVISDELRRAMDNDNRRRINFISDKLFGGAYSPYRTLGTFENIASFTRKQMKMFLARRLSGKNCLICVSGKIDDTDRLLRAIEKSFGWLPSFDVSNIVPNVTYTPGAPHLSLPKSNTALLVVVPALYQDADYSSQHFCRKYYGRYLKSELYRVMRDGLSYGVDDEFFGPRGAKINGFSTTVSPENVADAIKLMAKTARDVCTTNPITDEFLTRTHNRERFGDAQWLESPEKRCNKLVREYISYGNLYDYDKDVRISNELTAAQVRETMRGFFAGPLSIVTSGADFDADVMKIWRENFGVNAPVMQNTKDR